MKEVINMGGKGVNEFHIVITDIWTDRNKGDAALNIAIVRALKEAFPLAKISACSLFGGNQMGIAIQESSFTRKESISSFVGGLFPTYHKINIETRRGLFSRLFMLIRAVCTIGFAVILLLAIFLNLRKALAYLIPREFERSINVLSSADIVVSRRSVISSAINMGTNSLIEPYFLFKDLYHMCLAIILKKPLALFGCSIWPSINPLSRKLVKWILDNCIVITLREEPSYEYAVKCLGVHESKVHVLPDLAFYICSNNEVQSKPYPRNRVKPVIGVTFVDWQAGGCHNRHNYVNVMADFIRYITYKYNSRVIIIPQVVYPPQNSNEISRFIITKSKCENVDLIEKDFPLEELLELYSQCDFVIATPLHSGIFSLCAGTPTIMIAYDGGPKHFGVMKMLGMQDYVLPYEGLNLQRLIEVFEKGWANRKVLHRKAIEMARVLRQQVSSHTLLLKKHINCDSMT